jgi:hypothetical protein
VLVGLQQLIDFLAFSVARCSNAVGTDVALQSLGKARPVCSTDAVSTAEQMTARVSAEIKRNRLFEIQGEMG